MSRRRFRIASPAAFGAASLRLWRRLALAALLGLAAAGPAGAAATGAHDMVKQTADEVQKVLHDRHKELEKNPSLIYGVVQQYILPHFDFERMSQLVLGKAWRTASPAERQQFMDEFRLLLVRTYATAMLKYSDQKIDYLPYRGKPDDTQAVVQTEIAQAGTQPIPIDYSLYRQGDDWKVYDVKIDNVSLVVNYRGTFNNEVRNGGVAALIQKLRERNQQASAETAPGLGK
jgi:phospholipid transport system substrate-binding protein